MAEKVTIMVLKVDLECTKCYKTVKKLLCKYPQIRNQIYDEKANTVTIMVVCCSPEKIRDKLCHKGRGTIKSIDIKEPDKKKAPEPDKKKAPEPDKKKEPEKPIPKPVENPPTEKPKDTPKIVPFVLPPIVDTPKPPPKAPEPAPKAPEPGPKAPEPGPKSPEPAPKAPEPVPITAYPPPYYMPTGACCGTCYEGRPGGPCYGGHGMPMPSGPPPCNCGCGGHGMPMQLGPPPCNCGCGGGHGMPMQLGPPPCNCGCGGRSNCYNGYGGGGYTINRCDYFNEENSSACTVM